ncbi:hypothetical protein BaRGS_00021624 [Batillaria attramentaria]|uniref:Serine aminopeptidase S33 domain-containing protein n=1 Tax=Batillaria attramentaria TaxID=370345 RepID=A0ABD0KIV4_9CAEN
MEAKTSSLEQTTETKKEKDDDSKAYQRKAKIVALREGLVRCILHFKVAGFILFLACVPLPIFLKANSWLVPKLIFSTIVRWPAPFVNLSCPSDFGLNATRNFYMDVEDGIRVGAWHTLPATLAEESDLPWDAYEDTLKSGKTIFLYLHGNSDTRGGHHRVQLYKFLSKLDAHVLTIDYRGYGDSTGSPSVEGVVKDAHFAYKWLKEKSGGAPIFLWGHSLGTAITTKLAHKLCAEDDHPIGVILESPFNNMVDAAHHHPFVYPFRMVPGFLEYITESIAEHEVNFSSDHYITEVTPHILILHAEDDLVVPFHLGHKLYQQAKKSRSKHTGGVELVAFQGHHGYGHKHICKAPELPDIVMNFVEKAYADARK